MKKLLLILSIAICTLANAQAPQWGWGKSPAVTTNNAWGYSICSDKFGNVYTTGLFSGTINFGNSITLSSTNGQNYIVKYNSTGTPVWAKNCGNTYSHRILTDKAGNVYVTGHFTNSSTTIGSFTLNNSGSMDFFIAKFSANGNVMWAKSAGSVNDDSGNDIGIDANGNIYATGYFYGAIQFGSIVLSQTNTTNTFIVKYDSLGNAKWAKQSNGGTHGNGISVNRNGDAYITGTCGWATVSFGSIVLPGYASGSDMFIAKYNSSGNLKWAKRQGSSVSGAEGYSISSDLNSNVYVTGAFASSYAVFGNDTIKNAKSGGGTSDYFMARYDTAGNEIWAQRMGGKNNDYNFTPYTSNTIAIDTSGSGDVFFVGIFQSDTILLGKTDIVYGAPIILTVKFDAAGNHSWYINPKPVSPWSSAVFGMVSNDANQNVYLTGELGATSLSFYSTPLTSQSLSYIVKLCPTTAPVPTITQNGNVLTSSYTTGNQWYTTWPSITAINGATAQSYTVTSTGTYFVTVKDISGCDASSATITVTVTGINENEFSNLLSISPNPSNGSFTIQMDNGQLLINNYQLSIYNVLGEKVYEKLSINNSPLSINLSEAKNGIYFLQLKTEQGVATKKLIINK